MQELRIADFVFYVIPLDKVKENMFRHLFLKLLWVEQKESCTKNSYMICFDIFRVTLSK